MAVGYVVRGSQIAVGVDVAIATVGDAVGPPGLVVELTVGANVVAEAVGTLDRREGGNGQCSPTLSRCKYYSVGYYGCFRKVLELGILPNINTNNQLGANSEISKGPF